MNKHNIIIFQPRCWNDGDASGNTLSNLFSEFHDWNFLNIFLRGFTPNNNIHNVRYYQISIKDLLFSFFYSQHLGKECFIDKRIEPVKSKKVSISRNSSLLGYFKKMKLNDLIYYLVRRRWRHKSWNNNLFKRTIEGFNPDIIFSYAVDPELLNTFMDVMQSEYKVKVILYVVDDVYFLLKNKKRKELYLDCLRKADKVYAISECLEKKYTALINKPVDILFKGCKFTKKLYPKKNDNIKFVYAGNLLYGRYKTLISFVQSLKKCNEKNGNLFFLDIYSNSEISETLKSQLNVPNCSKLNTIRPYEEIMDIMNSSDIVIHVESFDANDIEAVRYSFSTKIMDCIECGSCFMVLGPLEDYSISFAAKVPGVICLSDELKIPCELDLIASGSIDLKQKTKDLRSFALQHYSIQNNINILSRDFDQVCF